MVKVAVVGGGFTGLNVAKQLETKALVTVFEKARGVSGRMSTRRAAPFWFDHGAQYFTARDSRFQAFLLPYLHAGGVKRWNANYVEMNGSNRVKQVDWSEESPRYVAVPGMNALAKNLAETLDVHVNTRIEHLKQVDGKWFLSDSEGKTYKGFDWVVVTAPAPQAAQLLPDQFEHLAAVKQVQMRACFSLMLGFDTPLSVPFDAARVSNSDISWMSVNSAKPGRTGHFSFLAHSSEEYAQQFIDEDRQAVQAHLCQQVSALIGHDVSQAAYATLHVWRFANNLVRNQGPVYVDSTSKLAAGGDWCKGGRVEGAFIAACELVQAMSL